MYHSFILPFASIIKRGFPSGSWDGKESACSTGDLGSNPGLGRSPGEGNGNTLQYSCLENSIDKGAWQLQSIGLHRARHSWVTSTFPSGSRVKNLPAVQQTQETRVPSVGGEDLLEEKMATQSNSIAWEIPWTDKPGRLHSMGLQRVRHNWATEHTHIHTHDSKKVRMWPNGALVLSELLKQRARGYKNLQDTHVSGKSTPLVDLGVKSVLG